MHYTEHSAGDALLRDSARVAKETLRRHDRILRYSQEITSNPDNAAAARFGGDEYVFILPYTNVSNACTLPGFLPFPETPSVLIACNRLQLGIQRVTEHTVSMGIANYPGTSENADLETLFKQADRAMYIAKRKGGNQCVIYDSSCDNHEK